MPEHTTIERSSLKQEEASEKINKAQALAIEHVSGSIQVLAGPGSGKTYLTIRRIRHLICHHGISPDKILVITFTKAAATEMEERFRKLTDNAYQEVKFGTFHSVYFHILKQSWYGKAELVSNKEQRKYITHILNAHGIINADNELIGELLQRISREKNESAELISGPKPSEISTDEKINEIFPDILKEYHLLMQEEHKIDFDDMILLCDRLLTEKTDVLSYWQKRFSHILVDEFQDIGALQYGVLKKLAAPENNLFVVGDDDQSIYGFRGAGPDIMQQFMTDYPGAVQLQLEMNYRCGSDIVKKSQLLIAENQKRFPKEIRAAKTEKGKVEINRFDTQEEQYAYLVRCIKQMSADELAQSALIGRTNAQLSGLSRRLVKEEIPFLIKSKTENIFTHDTAKDILAYLHFASDCYNCGKGKGKRSDFLRIRNKPCRYIAREALKESELSEAELLAYYKEKPYMQHIIRQLFDKLKKMAAFRPYLAIDYVRKTIGYDKYCCDGKKAEEQKKQMERLDELQQTALAYRSLEEWEAYIAEYTEKTEKTEKGQGAEGKGIHLITMHGSKGLEYENVFLIDVKKGIIPNRKAVSQEQLEEERRILYVAMTRAKSRLELLYWGEASCFLEMGGEKHMERHKM